MPIERNPGQGRPPINAEHAHWVEHILDVILAALREMSVVAEA